jgi:hypothetical protein
MVSSTLMGAAPPLPVKGDVDAPRPGAIPVGSQPLLFESGNNLARHGERRSVISGHGAIVQVQPPSTADSVSWTW